MRGDGLQLANGYLAPQNDLAAFDLEDIEDEVEMIQMPVANFDQDSSDEETDDEFYDIPEPQPAPNRHLNGGHLLPVQRVDPSGDQRPAALQGGGDWDSTGWDIPELYIRDPTEYFDEDLEEEQEQLPENIMPVRVPSLMAISQPGNQWSPFNRHVLLSFYNWYMTICRFTGLSFRSQCILAVYLATTCGVVMISYEVMSVYYQLDELLTSYENTLQNYELVQIQLNNLNSNWVEEEQILVEKLEELEATYEDLETNFGSGITRLFRSVLRALW